MGVRDRGSSTWAGGIEAVRQTHLSFSGNSFHRCEVLGIDWHFFKRCVCVCVFVCVFVCERVFVFVLVGGCM